MNTKTVGTISLMIGLTLVVSTGAVPGNTDEIREEVHLYPSPDDPSSYAYLDDDGHLALDVSSESAGGVNPNTRLWADEVFVIEYTGDGRAGVRIEDDVPDVEFYRGTYPDDVTSMEGEPVTLNPSESVRVGVLVDTSDRGAGERLLDTVSFDVAVDEPDQSRRPRRLNAASDEDGRATFNVTRVDVSDRETTVGSAVGFAVTVENAGDRGGGFVVDLSTRDARLARYLVEVSPGENVTWEYEHAFAERGTYPVLVNGVRYGTVDVKAGGDRGSGPGGAGAPSGGSATTTTITTDATATPTVQTDTGRVGVELGGFGRTGLLATVVVALVAMVLLGSRRSGGGEP